MPEGMFPFRYLGVPLHGKGLYIAEVQGLIQKLREKIQEWSGKNLSFAGRVSLINSVLLSIVRF